jgi:hypothetical protein
MKQFSVWGKEQKFWCSFDMDKKGDKNLWPIYVSIFNKIILSLQYYANKLFYIIPIKWKVFDIDLEFGWTLYFEY